jgi:capsular exopolysaccharide synthesis family protein
MTERLATDELELRHYVGVVWRRRLIVLSVVILMVGLALGYSFHQKSLYKAHADVLLQASTQEQLVNPANQSNSGSSGSRANPVDNEIAIMRSKSVVAAVMDKLGLSQPPKVGIVEIGDTEVVSVNATNQDPDRAATVAETYAETYIEQRRTALVNSYLQASAQIQAQIDTLNSQIAALQKPLQDLSAQLATTTDPDVQQQLTDQLSAAQAQAQPQINSLNSQLTAYSGQLQALQIASNITQGSTGGAQVISPAEPPSKPFSPKPIRNGIAGAMLGLILGIGLAFLRDHYDDTMKSKDDLESAAPGLPVLGLIPAVQGWKNRAKTLLISERDPTSAPAEAYRTLRTSLQFSSLEGEIGIVQVTSPQPGDGKTTTVVNLAFALAKAGLRVVVVDCDLRRPRMHEFFGLDHSVGLTTVLLGEASLSEAVQRVPGPLPLAVLASGEIPPNPSEVLSSPWVAEVFQRLREEADFVLADSPPVLPVADALVLAAKADAVALVATAGKTSRRDFRRAIELLDGVEAPLIGTILNSVEDTGAYGYGYNYKPYAKEAAAPKKGKAPRRRGKGKGEPADDATVSTNGNGNGTGANGAAAADPDVLSSTPAARLD